MSPDVYRRGNDDVNDNTLNLYLSLGFKVYGTLFFREHDDPTSADIDADTDEIGHGTCSFRGMPVMAWTNDNDFRRISTENGTDSEISDAVVFLGVGQH